MLPKKGNFSRTYECGVVITKELLCVLFLIWGVTETQSSAFKGGLRGKNGWNEGKQDADKKKSAKPDKGMKNVDCEIREHADTVDH